MNGFFNYKPPPEPEAKKERPESPFIPSNRIIIEGSNLIKVVEDNPEIPDGKVDIGDGNARILEPLNYDPETGVIEKWV